MPGIQVEVQWEDYMQVINDWIPSLGMALHLTKLINKH